MAIKNKSELRQDIVSGDWILLAPGRLRGKIDFAKKNQKRIITSRKTCPFELPFQNVNNQVLIGYTDVKNMGGWGKYQLLVLENKFPAVRHPSGSIREIKKGPFQIMPGVGHHDLLITRDHHKNFAGISRGGAHDIFKAFAERYKQVSADKEIAYVSIFHNWGPRAGASVYHPHYQIMSIPVIPPDVGHSLAGSQRYFRAKHRCAHCDMITWEKKERSRIIVENDKAIAFAPFVSRNPFEVRVFPKRHLPYFEDSSEADRDSVADVLQRALQKITKKMHDPDYNFFIHTAPTQKKNIYKHYHWHIEVYPKFSIRAGFEFGTGIEMNTVDPDLAAKVLRG